jgi:hypothetical protein
MKTLIAFACLLTFASCHDRVAAKKAEDVKASQELAMIISECKRVDTAVSESAKEREVLAGKWRDAVRPLNRWLIHHGDHEQMRLAVQVSSAMENGAQSLEKATDEFNRKMAAKWLVDYRSEVADAFAILTAFR